MSEPYTTKALDWFSAKQRGERLPEHEIVHCDLCGEPTNANPEIHNLTGMHVCDACIEATLEAQIGNLN